MVHCDLPDMVKDVVAVPVSNMSLQQEEPVRSVLLMYCNICATSHTDLTAPLTATLLATMNEGS